MVRSIDFMLSSCDVFFSGLIVWRFSDSCYDFGCAKVSDSSCNGFQTHPVMVLDSQCNGFRTRHATIFLDVQRFSDSWCNVFSDSSCNDVFLRSSYHGWLWVGSTSTIISTVLVKLVAPPSSFLCFTCWRKYGDSNPGQKFDTFIYSFYLFICFFVFVGGRVKTQSEREMYERVSISKVVSDEKMSARAAATGGNIYI